MLPRPPAGMVPVHSKFIILPPLIRVASLANHAGTKSEKAGQEWSRPAFSASPLGRRGRVKYLTLRLSREFAAYPWMDIGLYRAGSFKDALGLGYLVRRTVGNDKELVGFERRLI